MDDLNHTPKDSTSTADNHEDSSQSTGIYPTVESRLFLPHPDMREDRVDLLYEFIRYYPLATFITWGKNGLLANIYPFTLHMVDEATKQAVLRCHIPRGNAAQVDDVMSSSGCEFLIMFNTAPNAYITPNWYPSKPTHPAQVPTWNFGAVHVRGKLTVTEDTDWILQQINDLVTQMESRTNIPHKWKVSDAPWPYIHHRLGELIGVEVDLTHIEGKFKVSQEKASEREGIVKGLRGTGQHVMADLVQYAGIEGCPFMRPNNHDDESNKDISDNTTTTNPSDDGTCNIQ